MDTYAVLNGDCHDLPVVVSIPHSGTWLPEDIRAAMRSEAILASTDWYLPKLYAFLEKQGYTTLINRVNRYAADVNRRPGSKHPRDARGVAVYDKTTGGTSLYAEPLSPDEIARRIALYHVPYHAALRRAMDEKLARFGHVVLIDLHSFGRNIAPDVVLGTGRGTTASGNLAAKLREAMKDEGFRVAMDEPFAGGYIVHRYGSRSGSVEAVQIELNYAAYIGEHARGEVAEPIIDERLFTEAQKRLESVFAHFIEKDCP